METVQEEKQSAEADYGVHFNPVVQVRAHEYVAEQIRRLISLQLIEAGTNLPPERTMARQFKVSRSTVQLALRALETDRLIETSRGRGGGSYVVGGRTSGDGRLIAIAEVLRDQPNLKDLLGLRLAAEPGIAAAAAKSRTKRDLIRITEALEQLAESDHAAAYMKYDTELHIAIANASQNRYLVDTAMRIRAGLNELISLLPETSIWQARVFNEHRAMTTAIRDQNPNKAMKVMRQHILHTERGALAIMETFEHQGSLVE